MSQTWHLDAWPAPRGAHHRVCEPDGPPQHKADTAIWLTRWHGRVSSLGTGEVTSGARSQALGANGSPAPSSQRKDGRPSVPHVDATTQTQLNANDPLLSAEEVSALLGGIPTGTLKRWRSQRRGPVALHIGRHVRYRRSTVEAWLREKDQEAVAWMAL